ncbi:MAG: molybdate ABC transporter substrate-binding protein [Candidatus Hydrothermarchaeales archaeon]
MYAPKHRTYLFVFFVLIILLSGCIGTKNVAEEPVVRTTEVKPVLEIADTGTLNVLAGSASKGAVLKAKEVYERNTGTKVNVYFQGSGVLLNAMEYYKRGDIYIATSPDFMAKAEMEKVIYSDTIRPISFMNPTIIVPLGNPKEITKLEDLAKPGIKIGTCKPENCATGAYVRRLLSANNLISSVEANLFYVGTSYRESVDRLYEGEVDAVIGWQVFDLDPRKVEFVGLNTEIMPQMGFVIAGVSYFTSDRRAAQEFLNILISPELRDIYSQWGFVTMESPIDPVKTKEITAFVGSVSKPVIEEAGEAFERKTGIELNLHFSGSGAMLSNMKMSKVGDLYIPASPDYMSKARYDGLVYSDTEKTLTYLVPAIGVQKGNPKNIRSLEDLTKKGVRVGICDPENCVIGEYAVEIFEKNNLISKVKPNIVTHAPSASKTAALIPFGKVDAIVIWRVMGNWNPENMDIVLIDPAEIPRIAYVSGAISIFSNDKKTAQEFLDFLASEEGQIIFAKWGYLSTGERAKNFAPKAMIGGEYKVPEVWYNI